MRQPAMQWAVVKRTGVDILLLRWYRNTYDLYSFINFVKWDYRRQISQHFTTYVAISVFE